VSETAEVRIAMESGAFIPERRTPGAAGADLFARLEDEVVIRPGSRALIPTGLRMEIPSGFMGEIRPRSGLAVNHGVTVLNSPGTVDEDYRGEIKVLLANGGDKEYVVRNGDRIAQFVLTRYFVPQFREDSHLGESLRGEGGFGSTGK
jgi:dUTP pyrophosphatase